MLRRVLIIGLMIVQLVGFLQSVWAEQWTRDEVKLLTRLSASVRSGKKMLDPPEPNLIWLHQFSQNGPEDLRKVAENELMAWAVAAANSERAAAVWKVAEVEGQPELYARWVRDAEQHLVDRYRDSFPFAVAGISQLRPGGGDFIEVAQMKRHIQLRLLAVLNALKGERLLALSNTLRDRADARKHTVMDPVKDSTLIAEFIPSDGFSMLARITNRGQKTLSNVVIVGGMEVDAPDPAIPAGGVLMRNLNTLTAGLTGINLGNDDLHQANLLLDQWHWGQDPLTMVFLPELKPREQIAFAIGDTATAEYGVRASLLIYCDQFFLKEMPVVGLADWQKKKVAELKRRGVAWMNGEKPYVKADAKYENEFIKNRRSAPK